MSDGASAIMTPHDFPDLLVIEVEPPDEEAASVTLASGAGTVVAFCYPCELAVGSRVSNRLSVLDAEVQAAYLSDWPADERIAASKDRLERVGPYEYEGTGRVVDEELGLVLVQGFVIDFGAVLAGAGHVEFKIVRLDLAR